MFELDGSEGHRLDTLNDNLRGLPRDGDDPTLACMVARWTPDADLVATRVALPTLRMLAQDENLRQDNRNGRVLVLFINLSDVMLTPVVAFAGANYRLSVYASVTDPVVVAEDEKLHDIEPALVAHFRRAGSAVPVGAGGGVATAQGAGDLIRDFNENPPRFPGIYLELQDATPLEQMGLQSHLIVMGRTDWPDWSGYYICSSGGRGSPRRR
jgi:hypothetical protein